MRCFYCNKHEAVKTHERVEKGQTVREYYCLSCYERLVLDKAPFDTSAAPAVCPYCNGSTWEFEASKLVGCPYCYETLHAGVLPTILRMQGGDLAHRGKRPALSERNELLLEKEACLTEALKEEFRLRLQKQERIQKQVGELKLLVEHLKARDPEREKAYREQLERVQRAGETEGIVW